MDGVGACCRCVAPSQARRRRGRWIRLRSTVVPVPASGTAPASSTRAPASASPRWRASRLSSRYGAVVGTRRRSRWTSCSCTGIESTARSSHHTPASMSSLFDTSTRCHSRSTGLVRSSHCFVRRDFQTRICQTRFVGRGFSDATCRTRLVGRDLSDAICRTQFVGRNLSDAICHTRICQTRFVRRDFPDAICPRDSQDRFAQRCDCVAHTHAMCVFPIRHTRVLTSDLFDADVFTPRSWQGAAAASACDGSRRRRHGAWARTLRERTHWRLWTRAPPSCQENSPPPITPPPPIWHTPHSVLDYISCII